MVYVDENLCTGCGICIDACNQGALSVPDCTAVIDETLCTSCGRCIDVCLTGAIISVETVETAPEPVSPPSRALARHGESQPFWARPSSLPATATGAPLAQYSSPRPQATSKLDVVEKVLSGLFFLANYALNRRPSGSTNLAALGDRTRGGAASAGGGGGGRAGGRHLHGGGRGMGAGRGLGARQGCNDRRGNNR